MNKKDLSPQEWRQYLINGISEDPYFEQDLIQNIQNYYIGINNIPKLADTSFSNLVETTADGRLKINTDVLSTMDDKELNIWRNWELRKWYPSSNVTVSNSTSVPGGSSVPRQNNTSTISTGRTTINPITLNPLSSVNSNTSIQHTVPYQFDRFDDLSVTTQQPRNTKSTDWFAHLLNRMLSVNANNKVAKLAKQYKMPSEQGVTKQAIITNGSYLTNQLLEKQKQEMLARYSNMQTSDMNYNLALMNYAQQQDQQYEDKQAALQAQSFESANKNISDTINWNKVNAGKAAYSKAKADTAMTNYRLDAEQKRILSNAQANKSFIYDTYVDAGKKAQYDRELQAQKYLAELQAKYYQQDAAIDKEANFWSDLANWPNLSEYISELSRSGITLSTAESEIINRWARDPQLVKQGLESDPQFRNLVLSKFKTSTDEVTTKYKSWFEDYLQKLNTRAQQQKDYLGGMYLARKNSVNTTPDNQLWEYKKGGKVQLLKEYIKGQQKEQESVRKNANEYHKRASKELSDQLGALDKEQLLLLKSIFK